MKKLLISLLVLAMAIPASARMRIHDSLGMELFHLWRGLEVSKGLDFTNELSFSDNADHFRIGFWGGISVTGDYREFDYFISYKIKGFSIALWDIYNFSPGIYDNPDSYKIFNYNCHTTGHFLDLSVGYYFGDKVPLTLNWATIIAGRDRGINDKGKEVQRYSTFVSASYKVFENDMFIVTPSVGAEFAFRPTVNDKGQNRATFYGNRALINDIRLNVTYKLKIRSYMIPITATCMWNPEANKGYFGATIVLFSI